LFGNFSWLVPVLFAADIVELLVSVILGVISGVMVGRRGATNSQQVVNGRLRPSIFAIPG
jgi:hypothetical protein